jgi:hypothetical protein
LLLLLVPAGRCGLEACVGVMGAGRLAPAPAASSRALKSASCFFLGPRVRARASGSMIVERCSIGDASSLFAAVQTLKSSVYARSAIRGRASIYV